MDWTPMIFCIQAEQVARHDRAADSRAEADRDIEGVERRRGAEQFKSPGGNPDDEVGGEGGGEFEVVSLGEGAGMDAGGVEVFAVFNKGCALGAHGGVFLGAVAERDDDGDRNLGAGPGIGKGLAVIAARGGDNALDVGAVTFQAVKVGDATTDLEGAGRSVVFVLDPDFAAGTRSEKGPGVAGGGGKCRMNEGGGGFELGEGKHGRSIAQGAGKEKGRPAEAGAALAFVKPD